MNKGVVVRKRKVFKIPMLIITLAWIIALSVGWAFFNEWKDEFLIDGIGTTIFAIIVAVIPSIVLFMYAWMWRMRAEGDYIYIRKFFKEKKYEISSLKFETLFQAPTRVRAKYGPGFYLKGRWIMHVIYHGDEIAYVSEFTKKYNEFVAYVNSKIPSAIKR